MIAQQIKQQIAKFAEQGLTFCHVYLPSETWQELKAELEGRCQILTNKVGDHEIVLSTDLGLVHIYVID